ncbi:MAG: imidazole glycerol phosphate synthase subunit HisH [Deltaproteobacteria bacterium]|nr:imidazole glycerol phosphate synthase subunit HisH [Deltaproteobacteria bacterium]
MIAIVDYGMGNLRSVEKAFKKVGLDASVTSDAAKIASASKVVLPGVGAFEECMKNLSKDGLDEAVVKAVKSGKPFLGICLGLQLLFDESEEEGTHKGLGLVGGKIKKFGPGLKVPHMGWNTVKKNKPASPMLSGINENEYFYFVHSYYPVPDDKTIALTMTEYGSEFVSSIETDNIRAFQFHPEKSQRAGLKLIENFAKTR